MEPFIQQAALLFPNQSHTTEGLIGSLPKFAMPKCGDLFLFG